MQTLAVHENASAYASLSSPLYKKVEVTLTIALDAVPGWGAAIEDHIQLIFRGDSYVLKAEISQPAE